MQRQLQAQMPPSGIVLRDGRPVVVRLLRRYDAEQLYQFFLAVPRADARFYLAPSHLTRKRARDEANLADSPHAVSMVLETSNGFGGISWCKWKNQRAEVATFSICIRSDLQGHGAGRALATRVLQAVRLGGPPKVGLTVQRANFRALALYRSLGFELVREQLLAARPEDGFDPEPEYYMECDLRSEP